MVTFIDGVKQPPAYTPPNYPDAIEAQALHRTRLLDAHSAADWTTAGAGVSITAVYGALFLQSGGGARGSADRNNPGFIVWVSEPHRRNILRVRTSFPAMVDFLPYSVWFGGIRQPGSIYLEIVRTAVGAYNISVRYYDSVPTETDFFPPINFNCGELVAGTLDFTIILDDSVPGTNGSVSVYVDGTLQATTTGDFAAMFAACIAAGVFACEAPATAGMVITDVEMTSVQAY